MLRRPANYPVPGATEYFEGVIDPAGWFGPMFIDLRITRTDTPVRLHADRPLAQAQPVTEPLGDPNRDFGGHAVRARRLRKGGTCPFSEPVPA